MGKCSKNKLDVESLLEQIQGDDGEPDPQLLFDAIRHLTEIAKLTLSPEEKAKVEQVLGQLCGPGVDPGIPEGSSQTF